MEPNDASQEFAECLKRILEEIGGKLKVATYA